MSKGATACGISQSAASQHVHEVEKGLGVSLFDRGKRPLELTEAGKLYAEFCRKVLREEEEFRAALDGLKREIEGTVRVASIYSIGLSEMSLLREAFAERCATARLEVEYMRPDKIYDAVRNRDADLGLVSYPEASRELAVIPWREEEMRLAVPVGHPLAGRTVVAASDLNGLDYIAFDEDLTIRRELDKFLRANGVEVHAVMHFDNIQMIKEAVALGSGVSILPEPTLQADVAQGRLAAVPIDSADLTRPLGILHRKRQKINRAVAAFLGLLAEKGEAVEAVVSR